MCCSTQGEGGGPGGCVMGEAMEEGRCRFQERARGGRGSRGWGRANGENAGKTRKERESLTLSISMKGHRRAASTSPGTTVFTLCLTRHFLRDFLPPCQKCPKSCPCRGAHGGNCSSCASCRRCHCRRDTVWAGISCLEGTLKAAIVGTSCRDTRRAQLWGVAARVVIRSWAWWGG